MPHNRNLVTRESVCLTLFCVWVAALATAYAASGQPERTPLIPAGTSAEDTPQEHPSPTGDITLRDAAARALANNPDLAAFEWRIRGAEARVVQAGLRKNPELSLEIEDVRWRDAPVARTRSMAAELTGGGAAISWDHSTEQGAQAGFGETQTTLYLSQVVELGGKRVKRVGLARKEQDLARWDYEAARLDVLTQVAKAFTAVRSAQDRLELADRMVEVAEQVVGTVAARVEAGQVSPLESAKAETERAATRIEAARVRRDLDTARAELAATWGADAPDFGRVLGELTAISPVAPYDDVLNFIGRNPDLARWTDEMEARRAALKVERSLRIPDMTVTVGLRTTGLESHRQRGWSAGSDGIIGWTEGDTEYSRDRENLLVLGVSLPLPIFDRNQGSIREAECNVSEADQERRAAETQAHAALLAAYQDLSESYNRAAALRDDVLPRAKDSFERTQEGYRQGKFGFLDVLDAQRTWFDVQVQYLEALTAYHLARADVERLVGAPLAEVQAETAGSEPLSGESQHE